MFRLDCSPLCGRGRHGVVGAFRGGERGGLRRFFWLPYFGREAFAGDGGLALPGGLTHRQSFVDGLIALRCGLRRGAGAGPPCAGAGGRRGPERSLTFRILRCPRSGRGGGLSVPAGSRGGGPQRFSGWWLSCRFCPLGLPGVCFSFRMNGVSGWFPGSWFASACALRRGLQGVLWGSPCHQWGVVRISTTCELPVGVLSDPVSALASEAA